MKEEGAISWVDKLFKPVEPRLFEILAHNKSLVSVWSVHHGVVTNFELDRLFDGLAWLDSGFLDGWDFHDLRNDLLLAARGWSNVENIWRTWQWRIDELTSMYDRYHDSCRV